MIDPKKEKLKHSPSEQLCTKLIGEYNLRDIAQHSARLEADVKTILRVANKLEGTEDESKILNLIHLTSGFEIPGIPDNLKVGEKYTQSIKHPGKKKLSWVYESAFEKSSMISKKAPKNAILVEYLEIKRDKMEVVSVWSFTSPTSGKKMFIEIEVYSNKKKMYGTLIISPNNTVTRYHQGKIERADGDRDRGSFIPEKIDFWATLDNILKLVSGNVPDGFQSTNRDFSKLFVAASAV